MLHESFHETISHLPDGAKTILMVEKEPLVRSFLCRLLEQYSFVVLQAANGAEAVILAESFFYPIHLLIADLALPKMSGDELVDQLASHHPEMRILSVSSFSDGIVPSRRASEKCVGYLQKPFKPDELVQKVCECLFSSSRDNKDAFCPSAKQSVPAGLLRLYRERQAATV